MLETSFIKISQTIWRKVINGWKEEWTYDLPWQLVSSMPGSTVYIFTFGIASLYIILVKPDSIHIELW